MSHKTTTAFTQQFWICMYIFVVLNQVQMAWFQLEVPNMLHIVNMLTSILKRSGLSHAIDDQNFILSSFLSVLVRLSEPVILSNDGSEVV